MQYTTQQNAKCLELFGFAPSSYDFIMEFAYYEDDFTTKSVKFVQNDEIDPLFNAKTPPKSIPYRVFSITSLFFDDEKCDLSYLIPFTKELYIPNKPNKGNNDFFLTRHRITNYHFIFSKYNFFTIMEIVETHA